VNRNGIAPKKESLEFFMAKVNLKIHSFSLFRVFSVKRNVPVHIVGRPQEIIDPSRLVFYEAYPGDGLGWIFPAKMGQAAWEGHPSSFEKLTREVSLAPFLRYCFR